MKKKYVFFLLGQLICTLLSAQNSSAPGPVGASPTGNKHLVSLDLHLPIGVFARTHLAGAGFNYSWSNNRYGKDVKPSKPIGFTFNAGGDYYFGKQIKPAGYDFRYDGYLYFSTFAGIISNPWQHFNIALTAGPTLGIYKGNSDIGFGANLFGNYYIEKKISIGPGITYKKHSEADALWTISVRIGYLL